MVKEPVEEYTGRSSRKDSGRTLGVVHDDGPPLLTLLSLIDKIVTERRRHRNSTPLSLVLCGVGEGRGVKS